jgi:acyl-coenzyme A thioesterase PaaI-like protein
VTTITASPASTCATSTPQIAGRVMAHLRSDRRAHLWVEMTGTGDADRRMHAARPADGRGATRRTERQRHFFRISTSAGRSGADRSSPGPGWPGCASRPPSPYTASCRVRRVSVGFPASGVRPLDQPSTSACAVSHAAVADFTIESRLVKDRTPLDHRESWFTAAGERDPYALRVATFFSVGDPLPEGWQAPAADDPRFFPHHRRGAEKVGIETRASGTVELERSEVVSNGTTIQGGIIALLAERACESAVPDHVITGLDLRYLSIVRVGPARAVATPLRSDGREAHLWIGSPAGDDDRIVVHCLATRRPTDVVLITARRQAAPTIVSTNDRLGAVRRLGRTLRTTHFVSVAPDPIHRRGAYPVPDPGDHRERHDQ